ncbi:MAG: ATP-binding protein [Proteobacteria bacterium]|nr:ATP-binding protein [Pseudomonadota bacterium]
MDTQNQDHSFKENIEIVNYLKESRLFGHLADDVLNQLLPLSKFIEFPAGHKILVEGQQNDRVYFLIKGEVGVFAGDDPILRLKRKGDIFGEMSVISSKMCSATVIAKTPVTVFSIMAKGIGKYSDLKSDHLQNFFYRVFAMVLTEKLSLTTTKAQQYEFTNRLLEQTKKTLEQKILEQQQAEEKRLQLEAQLKHSQKLEAIGTLAGGIAHDFNNLLFAMLGYITMAKEDLDAESPVREDLEEAITAAKRAKDLVHQILTFSRQQEGEQQPIRISSLVKEALKMIRAFLPATIEIREDWESTQSAILADPSQIHQIVMNLCTNAGYAMRATGGTLEVNLADVEIDSGFASSHAISEGRYLMLSVSDTGHGIPTEDLDRIFDPFFTTKPVGEGTGMGLAVVHGIVRNHHGAITVSSEPGEKTVFTLYFPVIEDEIEDSQTVVESMPKGTEHILVVDDEISLVKLEKRILERCGYQVTTAISSLEALQLFRESPDYFDLVVSDLAMPKLDGAGLAKEMIKIKPNVQIILVTGYSSAISATQAKEIGVAEYVMKPIAPHEFSKTVRQVLDKLNNTL